MISRRGSKEAFPEPVGGRLLSFCCGLSVDGEGKPRVAVTQTGALARTIIPVQDVCAYPGDEPRTGQDAG